MLLGLCSMANCQDVKVNINNSEATVGDDCPYRLNGICITEDVGGVDTEIVYANDGIWAVFMNYNSFPVTVIYLIRNSRDERYEKTGTIVLGSEDSKKIKIEHAWSGGDKSFRDNFDFYSIGAVIARKLQNSNQQ